MKDTYREVPLARDCLPQLQGVRLDLVQGEVRFFGDDHRDTDGNRLKVPHMGWNQVQQVRQPLTLERLAPPCPLLLGRTHR